ncbi:MAG: sodium-dependent transporter [Muribaculaceae bacterium]|nr:sodium-dependent transporter [Muribaculaceae bacterium]
MAKSEFASKIGLIAATVGSAVGLGNIWRFPAETQANGGSAFLLLYIICVLVLGIPVMLAEFSLGRGSKSDAIGAFLHFKPHKPWWLVGALAVLTPYLICCYYMVVAGWTLEYLVESVDGNLYAGLSGLDTDDIRAAFATRMSEYISTDVRPVLYTIALLVINAGILLGGVQKGIERLSNVMMPILFVILAIMCVVSLSLPDASEGVRFFLYPDFTKITPGIVINALGQAFFSLSLGMGILITYSAYYPRSTNLMRTSVIVALMSLLVAIMVGLIIFPAIKSFGLDNESLEGATLVFVTLPEIFARMPLSGLWSTLFFTLLFVAALTSCVSIAEVPIATLQDRLHMSRSKAVAVVFIPLMFLSTLCALSFGSLSNITICGQTIFNFLDNITTNIFLPVVSLGVCIFVGWVGPRTLLRDELTNNGTIRSHFSFIITWVIRYLAPGLIVIIFLNHFL